MPEQVAFVGREQELQRIDTLIKAWGQSHIVCIHAEGGIGKTRLLQEVYRRYSQTGQSHRIVSKIIDFDDRSLHLFQNLGRKIASELDPDNQVFTAYFQGLYTQRKMELEGRSYASLRAIARKNFQTFYACFNSITEPQQDAAETRKHVTLLFDTTDALRGDIWATFFADLVTRVSHTLVLLAGRNAKTIADDIRDAFADRDYDPPQIDEIVQVQELQPLTPAVEAEEYLRNKERSMHFTIEPELRRQLLTLAGGKPILIDLAVEWRLRGITVDWAGEPMDGLSDEALAARRREFERQMVEHIGQRREHIDDLILLMSRFYPVTADMIAELLGLSFDDARALFEEAGTYVFVKHLPDHSISLHDEMRRMVNEYVWPDTDPDGEFHDEESLRYKQSLRIVEYLEDAMAELEWQIADFEDRTQAAVKRGDDEAEFQAFSQREAFERKLWTLKRQYLQHIFVVDRKNAVEEFAQSFDAASRKRQFAFRETLLDQTEEHAGTFSPAEQCIVGSRRLQFLFDKGRYAETDELASTLLQHEELVQEQRVKALILRANAKIRLGDIPSGIRDFEQAVATSAANHLDIWRFKALNGLGWAHRQAGETEKAQTYYEQARQLYNQVSAQEQARLEDDYGWLLNNLAFVLSNNNQTRRTAVNIARSHLEYWTQIGNEIGLGACYLVLGVARYRYDKFEPAGEAFQQAEEILSRLEQNDLLGQLYAWRGALRRDMHDLKNASADLTTALEIGTLNIRAMTFYCLGRVYMTDEKLNLNLAEHYMEQGLEEARKIPDFRYWLAAVVRLITIAVAKGAYDRLEAFQDRVEECLEHIEKPDKNALGMAYIGLAKLAFMQNDPAHIDQIVTWMEHAIVNINASYYANADILGQLAFLEKDFHQLAPDIIRGVGRKLTDFSRKKEQEQLDYIAVTPIMKRWAHWDA